MKINKSELYELVLLKRKPKKSMFRVKFTDKTSFSGVIVEYVDIKLKDKDDENRNNAELIYNIKKVPKRKFDNLIDEDKQKFETLVTDVFKDVLCKIIKQDKLDRLNQNIKK